ncbi:MAG TPA: ABC transporter substrate-binding protein [Candidatus Binatia bacterium]
MRLRLLICSGVIGLVLLAGNAMAQSKKIPIQIGAIHNITGSLGSIGEPSLNGALLAAKQLNERGGVLGRPVELVARDGQSDPAVVAEITRELVHMPHMAAITGLNDTEMALAAAPITEKGRMVFLTSGATSPKVPLQFPRFYFMACFGDNTQAAAGAEYAFGALGLKTAWLLLDNTTEFTVLLAGYFEKRYTALGGQILGKDTYAGGALDFSEQIALILSLPTRPEMLYVSAEPDDIGRLVNQMRKAGLDQPIFGGDGYDTPLLLETAGAAAHDTYFTTHVFLNPSQAPTLVQHFIADYENEYGVPPETAFAALAYDSVMLVANAIERANSAKQKDIAGAIELTDHFPGVSGSISFAPGVHIPEKEVTIVHIVGDRRTLATVLQPQEVPPPEDAL